MDDKRNVQDALNRSLSGLRPNPYLARRVLAEAKGEKKMKRHISKSLILVLILSLALIGTAYAAITSRVPEFFTRMYGQDMGDYLLGGRAAQIGESVTVGGLTITIDEVVYRNQGLYGVGTVKAADEKDVLISMDEADNAEFAPKPVEEHLRQAKEKGGRLLYAFVLPSKIGVDGGAMLTPGCIGSYDERNKDGTVTFSFEVEDRFSIEDGETYQLEMDIRVYELHGSGMEEPVGRTAWTVEFTPVRTETTVEPGSAAEAAVPEGDYEIRTPEAYRQEGTLSVYRAEAVDFTERVDPAWFNQSGVAEKHGDTGVTFSDHAQLTWSREGVWYAEYTEEMFDYNAKERELYAPDIVPAMGSVPSLCRGIADIAGNVFYGLGDFGRGVALEKEQLTKISLSEAKRTAENLLEKLGLSGSGFTCGYALDMSLERISALSEQYNRFWFEGEGYTNNPRLDFSKATADDEGYFLYYSIGGLLRASEGRYQMSVYVTAGGIRDLNLRCDFARGEALYTPDRLITPQEAVETLAREAAKSRYGEAKVASVKQAALGYTAVRAEKPEDGMVFVPMWQIAYQDAAGEGQDWVLYAEINAVDGTLIYAPF